MTRHDFDCNNGSSTFKLQLVSNLKIFWSYVADKCLFLAKHIVLFLDSLRVLTQCCDVLSIQIASVEFNVLKSACNYLSLYLICYCNFIIDLGREM